MPYRFLYFVCTGVALAALMGWFASAWTWEVAPRTPDAIQRVAENNHGHVIYLTPFEALLGPTCWIVGAGSAIAGKIFKKRYDSLPKSRFFF